MYVFTPIHVWRQQLHFTMVFIKRHWSRTHDSEAKDTAESPLVGYLLIMICGYTDLNLHYYSDYDNYH